MEKNTVQDILDGVALHQRTPSSPVHGCEINDLYEQADTATRAALDTLIFCLTGLTHCALMDKLDDDATGYVRAVHENSTLNTMKASRFLHREIVNAPAVAFLTVNETIKRLTGVAFNHFERLAAA